MNTAINYVLILASGGIDSTACIQFYKKLGFQVELMFFDYGQLSRKQEYLAITSIAEHYNIPLKKVVIKQIQRARDGFVMGRNAMFYFLALTNFDKSNGLIASGIHYGTDYYDCSQNFINLIQEVFDNYSSNTIKIGVPFVNLRKTEIIAYCILEKVPIHLTYSCELGKKQPCGICLTCKELSIIKKEIEQ